MLIKADGSKADICPEDGAKFTLADLQKMCGGTIDIHVMPGLAAGTKMVMIVNDNGKLEGLPYNDVASRIFREWYPIEEYPQNNDAMIVGDVVICPHRRIF